MGVPAPPDPCIRSPLGTYRNPSTLKQVSTSAISTAAKGECLERKLNRMDKQISYKSQSIKLCKTIMRSKILQWKSIISTLIISNSRLSRLVISWTSRVYRIISAAPQEDKDKAGDSKPYFRTFVSMIHRLALLFFHSYARIKKMVR